MSQPQTTIDVAGWVGQYPFRGIHNSSLAHLTAKLESLQIERAIVSPFEALFWENNLDAWQLWAARLADKPRLELWPVVNPAQPGQLSAFESMLDAYRPRGLRLLPNYHGYQLADPAVETLMRLADQRGMIVQVFQRIADERWHWMLPMPAVQEEELVAFVQQYPHQRILISGMNHPQVLAEVMAKQPQLYADISRLRGPLFAVERLVEQVPAQRLTFGSLWPIQVIEATLWQLWDARIPEASRQAMLYGNAQRLLNETAGDAAQAHIPAAVQTETD